MKYRMAISAIVVTVHSIVLLHFRQKKLSMQSWEGGGTTYYSSKVKYSASE